MKDYIKTAIIALALVVGCMNIHIHVDHNVKLSNENYRDFHIRMSGTVGHY